MNKLEEYRITSVGKVYQVGDINNNLAAGGYLRGFDAAIALDLPVKFEEWKIRENITWYAPEGSIPSYFDKTNHSMDISSPKELYQYWITHIYKPE